MDQYFKKRGGGDYIQVLVPGIISMSALFTAMFPRIEVISDKQFGFLKETMVAPVSRSKIMIGRTLGGATVAFLQGLIVFLICLLIGFKPVLATLPLAFVFMFLIAVLFTALGTAIASKLDDMQAFPIIINFLIMPIFFISGALFPITNIPTSLQIITLLNPLSYGVDGIRGALIGNTHFGYLTNLIVLITFVVIITLIGTRLFEKMEI